MARVAERKKILSGREGKAKEGTCVCVCVRARNCVQVHVSAPAHAGKPVHASPNVHAACVCTFACTNACACSCMLRKVKDGTKERRKKLPGKKLEKRKKQEEMMIMKGSNRGRMTRGGHALPQVSPRPAMLYLIKPSGWAIP
jgi:hypothetical protein